MLHNISDLRRGVKIEMQSGDGTQCNCQKKVIFLTNNWSRKLEYPLSVSLFCKYFFCAHTCLDSSKRKMVTVASTTTNHGVCRKLNK